MHQPRVLRHSGWYVSVKKFQSRYVLYSVIDPRTALQWGVEIGSSQTAWVNPMAMDGCVAQYVWSM